MKLKRKILVLLALVLTFTALFAVMMLNTSAAEGDTTVTIDGKNYTIPADKMVNNAAVAVFAKAKDASTYTFIKTDTAVANGFTANALDLLAGTYKGGEVYMYLLRDFSETRTSGWNTGMRLNGTFTLDLGGHTYTNTTAPRLVGFLSNANAIGYDSTFRMKNGTFSTTKVISEIWAETGTYTGTKTCNVIFDNVTIHSDLTKYTLFSAKTSTAGSFSDTMKANYNVTLNNCTFDTPKADPVTVISDLNPEGHVTCNVKINDPTFNTVRFAASNGKKTDTANGMTTEDTISIKLKGYDVTFNEDFTREKLLFSSDKKFYMFGRKAGSTTYDVIDTFGSYDGMIGNVPSKMSGSAAYVGGEIVTYLIVDQSWTGIGGGSGWNAASQINGKYTFDLGGNKFVSSAPRMIGFLAQNSSFDTTIAVKNGTLETSKVIAEVWNEKASYTGTKNCNLIFEDLKIIRSGSPTSYTMLATKTNGDGAFSDTMKANFNVEFNNCNIDYSTANTLTIINDGITKGTVECNVSVKGGNISAKTVLNAANGFSSLDSFKFDKNESGKRTTFVFDYATDCSELTYPTDAGAMHLAATSVGNRVAYELSNTYVDGYGYIPSSEANKTFSVFDVEKKLHLGSYNAYYDGMLERVRHLINSYSTSCNGLYADGAVTAVLRKDYNHTDNWYGNYAHLAGEFTLDLGGHTITQTSNGLFNFIAKKTNFGTDKITMNDTTTIVKNGTILTRNQPVVKVNNNRSTGNFDYDGTKIFNITFDGVTFDKHWATNDKIETYNPIIKSEIDGDLGVDVNATFNNCSFTSCNSTIIDAANSNAAKFTVNINGGVINTDNMSTLKIMTASDSNDTLTFGKDNAGNYASLVLPTSANAPTETYNNGNLVFVKINEGAETTTYRLREKSVANISYSPKMSLTLDRNLYLNVYIPAENLVKFDFDGTSYENLSDAEQLLKNIGGKDYYVISTALPSPEAARDLILNATIKVGDNTANGKFTFSIPKYAKTAFGSGSLVEKQVVRDVLSYIRAAYVYFNPADTKAIAAIDTLIGKNYDVTSPVTSEGSTVAPTEALVKATLDLSAMPGIRFYIPTDANAADYSFYRIENGSEIALDTENGTDSIGRYIEISVYAYALCDTIYYRTVNGASGSYHIASYHAWAKTQNDANLVNLVERYWKYAESASDYKNAVKVTVNYVDENGNALSPSQSVTKAPTDEVKFISPAIDGYYTRDLYVYSSSTENETVNVVYRKIHENVSADTARGMLDEIVAWGDSITEGSNVNNVNAARDHGIDLEALGSTAQGGSYREVLKNLIKTKLQLEKYTVYNLGVGSESTTTIAARANTENYYFYINTAATLEGNAIVIDLQQHTGTKITDGTRMGVLRRNDSSGGYISNVYMTGKDANGNEVTIPGLLTCTTKTDPDKLHCTYDELTYTFTRTDGKTDKVTFDKNTRVVTQASVLLDGKTCIIFMGENGGYNWDNDTIIAQQEEMLEACGNPEHFIIVSSTSKTTAKRQSLNDALTARWGEHYINMGNVLNSSRDSYEFAGYSEEAIVAILDNIIEGSVTDLLLADSCHPQAVGYAVIANTLFEKLFNLGAFDGLFDYYDSFYA